MRGILVTLLAIIVVVGLSCSVEAMAGSPPAKTLATQATLDKTLKSGLPVVVKLGSDQCPPCRAMEPIINELAIEQKGKAIFLSLDIYQNRELARQAKVRVIPTTLFYDKQGRQRGSKEGFMNKEQLLQSIQDLALNK